MKYSDNIKSISLHMGVVTALFLLQFILPDYYHLTITRIMVLSVFAMGYNLIFGYVGLLSLGHAMFFGVGLYCAGITSYYFAWNALEAFIAAIICGMIFSFIIGLMIVRTTGVSFMIVTMMFSQSAYLATLYFIEYTNGDEGFIIPQSSRIFFIFLQKIDLTNPDIRYNIALALLAITIGIIFKITRSPFGLSLIAIRENPARTAMLGYNIFAIKLKSVVISGTISASAGGAYALLFAYVGSSFTSIEYSIDVMLYTLLGGAGTILGPIIGAFLIFFIIDIISGYTIAYMIIIGIILIFLILFFPRGILGTIKDKWLKWLP